MPATFTTPAALKKILAAGRAPQDDPRWKPHLRRAVEICVRLLADRQESWAGVAARDIFLSAWTITLTGGSGTDLVMEARASHPPDGVMLISTIWRIDSKGRAATIYQDTTGGSVAGPFSWQGHDGFLVERSAREVWCPEYCWGERAIFFPQPGGFYLAGRYPECGDAGGSSGCPRIIELAPRQCGFSILSKSNCEESDPVYMYWPMCWDPEDEAFVTGEAFEIDQPTFERLRSHAPPSATTSTLP